MSESLSWMQTGDTLALSGELDQDVLKTSLSAVESLSAQK